MKRFGRSLSHTPRRAGEVAANRLLPSAAAARTFSGASCALGRPRRSHGNTCGWGTISAIGPEDLQRTNTRQARTFSSTYLKPSPSPSQSPSPSSSVSLRRLSAPFLLLCHPDKISSSSPDLREANLRATQTLNGLIDTVEALYDRCGSGQSVSTQPAGRIELQGRYEVEFLVPCSSDDDLAGGKKKKRGDGGQTSYTRRSIIITYPASLRDDVQIVDGTGRYSLAAAAALRRRTAKEIVRLLKVAGASVPEDVLGGLLNDSGAGGIDGEHGAASYGHEDYLVDEMDLGGLGVDTFLKRGRFRGASDVSGSRRPRTQYEKSRQDFVQSVDWAELRRRTEDALQDAEADMATSRIMKRDERRKEQMISNVLSRVTVDANPVRESNENADDNSSKTSIMKDKRTDEEKGLDPISQLIALRRLSLLLADNFDELQMDDMSKLWDNTHIVLTPSRGSDDGSPARDEAGNTIVQSSAAYGISRRRNPLIASKESGFKFTYGSDGGITVYVPIDFTDEELTLQLTSNVWDVYKLCGDGVEDLYPNWFKQHG